MRVAGAREEGAGNSRLEKRNSKLLHYRLDFARPLSIGRVRAFFGNVGVLVRALVYIRSHGPDGLKRISENAVLNANYLLSRVKHILPVPQGGALHARICGFGERPETEKKTFRRWTSPSACSISVFMPRRSNILFPLTVPEAMMIEPTESESKETLDAFAEALFRITEEDAQLLHQAPHTTAVSRPDEVRAARQPVLVYGE